MKVIIEVSREADYERLPSVVRGIGDVELVVRKAGSSPGASTGATRTARRPYRSRGGKIVVDADSGEELGTVKQTAMKLGVSSPTQIYMACKGYCTAGWRRLKYQDAESRPAVAV